MGSKVPVNETAIAECTVITILRDVEGAGIPVRVEGGGLGVGNKGREESTAEWGRQLVDAVRCPSLSSSLPPLAGLFSSWPFPTWPV
jgi:hypothetical protein